MSNYHPTSEMLRKFCRNELDDVMNVMVSAHLHYCAECREEAEHYDAALGTQMFSGKSKQSMDFDLDAMLSNVFEAEMQQAKFASIGTKKIDFAEQSEIKIRGRSIELPPVLQGMVQRSGPWNHVVKELWQSPVTGHGLGYQVDFIYMDPGGTIPQHTHKGKEYTIVLDGSFTDDQGEYLPGDFMIKDSGDHHAPISTPGCLCLAAIDSPLHFTSGISRLLNPFSSLFFRSEA